MRSKILGVFFIITLLTGVFAAIPQPAGPLSSGGTIYVDDDNASGVEDGTLANPYNTIQEGVDAAASGDTVYVFVGTYYENVVINTTLTLEGEDRDTTIVDGGEFGDVILINIDWVNVTGFTVFNGGADYYDAGIEIYQSINHCSIENCNSSNNYFGIYLNAAGSDNLVANNTCYMNSQYGIYMRSTATNTVVNNTCISNNYRGIHLYNTDYNVVIDNTCILSNESGITLTYSSHNIIENNLCYSNPYSGIQISASSDNTIASNSFSYNDVGIYVSHSSENNVFEENTCEYNRIGIYLSSSINNTYSKNSCNSNDWWGICVGYSTGDIVEYNTCSQNIFTGIIVTSAPDTIVTNNVCDSNGWGIRLSITSDDTIDGNICRNNAVGIYLGIFSNNTEVANNICTSNWQSGISLREDCYNNTVSFNTISENDYGFQINQSNDNVFSENMVLYNNYTAEVEDSRNNVIYHNYFFNNSYQPVDQDPANNSWYHSVLLEGNYWSDYFGLDDGSGLGKHAVAGDGIGDTDIPHPGPYYDFYPFIVNDVGVYDPIDELNETDDYFQNLPDEWLKNGNPKKAFHNQIESVYKQIENEAYKGAIKHLEEIRDNKVAKWIVSDDPNAQAAKVELTAMINDLIAYLESLL